eukprot:6356092-Amphidinium_carterae.1
MFARKPVWADFTLERLRMFLLPSFGLLSYCVSPLASEGISWYGPGCRTSRRDQERAGVHQGHGRSITTKRADHHVLKASLPRGQAFAQGAHRLLELLDQDQRVLMVAGQEIVEPAGTVHGAEAASAAKKLLRLLQRALQVVEQPKFRVSQWLE